VFAPIPSDNERMATMAKPVNEHTTMVSMNVCVIDTSAWRTGSRVCAASHRARCGRSTA